MRLGAVGNICSRDSPQYRVEGRIVDMEGVVQDRGCTFSRIEIDGERVAHVHRREGAGRTFRLPRHAMNFSELLGGRDAVRDGDDEVIESDGRRDYFPPCSAACSTDRMSFSVNK